MAIRKLMKLFDISSKKLEKQLDIINIVRNLRNLKIITSQFVDESFKFYVERNKKNVINLDTSDSDEAESKYKSQQPK